MAKHFRRLSYWVVPGAVAGIIACGGDVPPSGVGVVAEALCSAGRLSANDADYIAVAGQTVTWTGSASCALANPEYAFWRQSPGESWDMVRSWSPVNTYDWSTAGASAGNHHWQVWVREAGSTAAYETYSGRTFAIANASACTSVAATATPAIAGVGTEVAISASAACGGQPAEYAFYRRDPGASSWTLAQPYGPVSVLNWNTSGAAAGAYQYQIWVRAVGRPNAYDAYTAIVYSLQGGTPCTNASVGFSPVSPGTPGDVVRLQGSSAQCETPTYKFYVLQQGAWTVLQDWSVLAEADWDTAALQAGTYPVQVWVRQQGSTANYESYAGRSYVLAPGIAASLATSVSCGASHTCQLAENGQVGCWGYNLNGQLGNGSSSPSQVPVAVSGLTTGVRLAVGYYHSCAVLSSGEVRCWGANLHGQLGNGTTADANSPVSVSGLAGAVGITAGAAHSCALSSNGSVRCWGFNSRGQLGVAPNADRTTPVAVSGLTGAASVAAGYYHTCALMSGGTVRCWGRGAYGELGNGSTADSVTPVEVDGLTGVTAISAASSHTCALLSDGTVHCWGQNNNGVLGNGTTVDSSVPVQVVGVSGATGLGVGPYHTCVATNAGGAYCWGLNAYGELGNGTTTDSLAPTQVTALGSVSSIGVGWHHSCARLSAGGAVCWGYNYWGQLGNNSSVNSHTPTTVVASP